MHKTNVLGDAVAFLFVVSIISYLSFFSSSFTTLTSQHPYLMGFVKFGLLATFGRLLAFRLVKTKRWEVNTLLLPQALLWGLTGIWITAAFSMFGLGTTGLMSASLWPQTSGVALALSKSLWINLLGGYGFFMMFVHEISERFVCSRLSGQLVSPAQLIEQLARENWFVPIFITVFVWWVPAHTITFLLPRTWQILFAASLSIVLGLIKALIARSAPQQK
ncbi:MAG TPA: hypothetical protein PKL83_02095 [bacterium]|nr:hypothetical protein [bacterium]